MTLGSAISSWILVMDAERKACASDGAKHFPSQMPI